MNNYHHIESCNKCGCDMCNIIIPTILEQGHIEEANTTCEQCGHRDYWAYGHFQSSSNPDGIESKCTKY